jgi:transposase-like protein
MVRFLIGETRRQLLIRYNLETAQVQHTQGVTERWRAIDGYGIEVSDLGGVRSSITKKPRKISYANGYKQIGVWHDYTGQGAIGIHRLVMFAFAGPCPAGKEVDHINGIRDDNRLSNLRYVTRSENINGTVARGHRGSNRWNTILTDDKVRQIKEMHRNGYSVKAIAETLNITQSPIFHIIAGRSWTHVK